MKTIILSFFTVFFFSVVMISCANDGFKDEMYFQLSGMYEIYSDKHAEGTITFNSDGSFKMNTVRGIVEYGDYSVSDLDKDTIVITWAEDEDGVELLTEYDYNNGYYVKYKALDDKTALVSNLPYYRNEEVMIKKIY